LREPVDSHVDQHTDAGCRGRIEALAKGRGLRFEVDIVGAGYTLSRAMCKYK
jgi:hypothetical protein